MKNKIFFFLLILPFTNPVFAQTHKHELHFITAGGHSIKVSKSSILYDNRKIKKLQYDDVLYESKLNQLIEDHGVIFLFIAVMGNPNLDRFNAYNITPLKATLVADAILCPIKDYDGDGYLEFGGRNLTEAYPNRDSMYYIPTAYFEIRDGKIKHDLVLTKKKDIAINGLYLPPGKQLDGDGFCCKVIPVPGRNNKTKLFKHINR